MRNPLNRIPGRWIERARSVVGVGLHVGAILGGWALVTEGLARLTVPEVRWLSGGLLLLSLAGWGHLKILFGAGCYALMKAGER